MVKKLST